MWCGFTLCIPPICASAVNLLEAVGPPVLERFPLPTNLYNVKHRSERRCISPWGVSMLLSVVYLTSPHGSPDFVLWSDHPALGLSIPSRLFPGRCVSRKRRKPWLVYYLTGPRDCSRWQLLCLEFLDVDRHCKKACGTLLLNRAAGLPFIRITRLVRPDVWIWWFLHAFQVNGLNGDCW